MSRKSRQSYSIRHLLQLPQPPRSPPAAHPPAPCAKVCKVTEPFGNVSAYLPSFVRPSRRPAPGSELMPA
ncbi:hypothetical protein EVAR_29900_1 [Eumeta japonica]|uniref:Uncharacterized protein n=1 Tax=Eumeta variegata TaxID=151549 RepID=A0A4C1VA03_EUMVA|nr:hypothetical protein EVAR_29900_1 [Eumeta japonica]